MTCHACTLIDQKFRENPDICHSREDAEAWVFGWDRLAIARHRQDCPNQYVRLSVPEEEPGA